MARHIAPTTEITTPVNGHKVVVKDWITGRDTEWVNGAFYEGLNAKPTADGGVQFGNFELSRTTKMTHRSFQVWVASVDGILGQDNVLEEILSMHDSDYQFILAEINERAKKK